jgi:hypothetical protein
MATYQFEGQDIVAPFRITSNEPAFSADTVTLKTRRVRQGAQRWELEFGVTMTDASSFLADTVSTFHDLLTMEMPQLNSRGETISQGTSTSAVTTSGVHSANDSTVTLTGANGTISKGRFIKFGNHNKIYLVTATYSGTGDISIYPSLRSSVPAATSVLYRDSTDNITLSAYRDVTNINGIIFTDGVLSEAGTINLIEAL